ncbi:MAG: hypothetical protein ABI389_05380 [Rhodanobacter sp.]
MDETAAWQPVAAALKLDHAEFERRVVAALPRIVRQDLDRATAERITQVLQALHVDARVLPGDLQLVYIERAGVSRGPLPQSALGDFIQPGESYRLRGDTTWQPWPRPVDLEPAAAPVGLDAVNDATASASPDDETVNDRSLPLPISLGDETREPLADAPPGGTCDDPERATPASLSTEAADQRSDIAQEDAAARTDAELPRAMPPPLRSAPAAPPSSAPEPSIDAAASAPQPDETAPTRQDDLVEPTQEALSSDMLDAAEPAGPEVAEVAAPKRSGSGWLVMLVVLIALAIWAYHYRTASPRGAAPNTAARAIQPSGAHAGQSTPSARAVAGGAPTPPLASPVSVAEAIPTPAPAATAAAPATAGSTPAATASAAVPPAATSTSVPATSTAAAATSPSRTLPANAGTAVLARPAPAAASSTGVPATPGH